MSDHVYKMLELTGSSATSIEDAVANAIVKAAGAVLADAGPPWRRTCL